MAEAFAPFIIKRTIGNLTFYVMEGRSFVRKKSSLTRKRVLHSPRFERTRQNAGLMGRASKVGSFIYNSLPIHWRQSWMFRSFTGEAYTLLKKGREELEIRQLLWDRYVQEVTAKRKEAQPLQAEYTTTKRTYTKQDTSYWENKTRKCIHRKARMQQRQRYAGLLAEASKIASELYNELPAQNRKRSHFQELTGWAMKWLKEQEDGFIMMETLAPTSLLPDGITIAKEQRKTNEIGYVNYQKRFFFFISPVSNCLYRDGRHYLKRSAALYPSFDNLIIPHPV